MKLSNRLIKKTHTMASRVAEMTKLFLRPNLLQIIVRGIAANMPEPFSAARAPSALAGR